MDKVQLRDQLTGQLDALLRRVREIEEDSALPLDDDFGEQAVQREDDQVLDSLENAALMDIAGIEAALRRLDLGTYGLCTVCSGKIEASRLAALPAASKCLRCAEMNGDR